MFDADTHWPVYWDDRPCPYCASVLVLWLTSGFGAEERCIRCHHRAERPALIPDRRVLTPA